MGTVSRVVMRIVNPILTRPISVAVMRVVIVAVMLVFASWPVCRGADDMPDDDAADRHERENPSFDEDTTADDDIDVSKYTFIRRDINRIDLNGADWSGLRRLTANTDADALRIVHIGDSHVQADMLTGCVRSLLQRRLGTTGRGLIVPLRLAGTNQPNGYNITSNTVFRTEKLIKHPWEMLMGFTGISLIPTANEFDFTITADELFEQVCVFYTGDVPSVTSVSAGGAPLVYVTNYEAGYVEVYLPHPCDSVAIGFSSFGQTAICGMELISDQVGVAYNTIGNNGATYASYNQIADFGQSVAMLEPALIILSLGTNDAFGRVDDGTLCREVDTLVSELSKHNPMAEILIVTPAECQRRLRRRSRSHTVNDNVASVCAVLRQYAHDNGVALYDWYEISGGNKSSQKWAKNGLLGRDRVHCTPKGYRLGGRMLYEALINEFEAK